MSRLGTKLLQSQFYQYHHFSKHTLDKLMSNRHGLDWANQPNPFRSWDGAPPVELPADFAKFDMTLFEAAEHEAPPQELDLKFLSNLFFYSTAISAWKQIRGTNHKWALRVNPSSGNLHPTETHLLVQDATAIAAGAYHYRPEDHFLEQRSTAEIGTTVWSALTGHAVAPPLLLVMTSIFWREAWKYQHRAYRYCQHDMGHALAAICLSARLLGWQADIRGIFPDKELSCLIGLDKTDEHPLLIIGLFPFEPHALKLDLAAGRWHRAPPAFVGTANRLSDQTVPYPAIDRVHEATSYSLRQWQERAGNSRAPAGSLPAHITAQDGIKVKTEGVLSLHPVNEVIRSRRSAVDMDGRQQMSAEHLMCILKFATRGFLADFQRPSTWQPINPREFTGHHFIHLYLYVHRINDVSPGLYYYDRAEQHLMPLKLGDAREAARYVSCFQDIAADGCFAVSMVADLNLAFEQYGDRGYRFVHYEAGWIGQWLYLAATALDYEATGIGCFLDDEINRLFDLPGGHEVIYNFTIGRAVPDPRLTSLPAYKFL